MILYFPEDRRIKPIYRVKKYILGMGAIATISSCHVPEIEVPWYSNLTEVIYASPTGTGSGLAVEDPMDLQGALNSSIVLPGYTIILLDGTYTGNFTSTVSGTSLLPIYIRPQNYMSATIDGSLQIGDFSGTNGAYTIMRNIEFTNSDEWRGTWETPQGTVTRPPNIYPAAPNIELINCMYHDGGVGVSAYGSANGLVLYGTIGFNNGWADDIQGGAQNIYIHSLNKTVKHCVFAGAFKKSVAVYTTNETIENIILEENVVFSRGTLMFGGDASDGQVVSGGLLANHVLNNGIQLGYTKTPNISVTCDDNRVYGDNPLTASYFQYLNMRRNKFTGQEASGNGCFELNYTTEKITYDIDNNEYHKIGIPGTAFNPGTTFAGWQAAGYDPNGTYDTDLPSTNEVFIYPNEYPAEGDKRMGMVVIWNWCGLNDVPVDLSLLGLSMGSLYRWRQAQDPLNDNYVWVYNNTVYSFPMTGHTVAKPIGFDEELVPTQFPTFGCFIIELV